MTTWRCLAPAALLCTTAARAAEPSVQETITGAQTSMQMLAHAFQAPGIAQALADASRRGVQVRIVVDKKRNQGKTSRAAIDLVTRHGVALRTNGHFHIHHDKTIIADGHTVETGSFNFAPSAETLNSENVVVLRGMLELARHYSAHWQSRGDLGKRYPAR